MSQVDPWAERRTIRVSDSITLEWDAYGVVDVIYRGEKRVGFTEREIEILGEVFRDLKGQMRARVHEIVEQEQEPA